MPTGFNGPIIRPLCSEAGIAFWYGFLRVTDKKAIH
jgi:hypothetical protein